MALFLEILEGPAEGRQFRLQPGYRIGRTTGEIILSDPKISALHAQVESSENGQLFLLDKGSANGLKINGQKVAKVALLHGVRFQIGKSLCRVVEMDSSDLSQVALISDQDWKAVLKSQAPSLKSINQSSARFIRPFSPLVELNFLEGLQAGMNIVLGYGPRKAGSDVLDIELKDPEAPDIAFELIPLDEGLVQFHTNYPTRVLVNGIETGTMPLKTGDRIHIGVSLIEVRFIK